MNKSNRVKISHLILISNICAAACNDLFLVSLARPYTAVIRNRRSHLCYRWDIVSIEPIQKIFFILYHGIFIFIT